MRNFLKRPVVVTALCALFGMVTYQTGSVLAVLGLLTLGYMGWDLAKGGSLSRVVTLPAAAWAGGLAFYHSMAGGAPISAVIGNVLAGVMASLYVVWALTEIFRQGWNTSWTKLIVVAMVVLVLAGVISSMVSGV